MRAFHTALRLSDEFWLEEACGGHLVPCSAESRTYE